MSAAAPDGPTAADRSGAWIVWRHLIAWLLGLGRNAWLFPLDLMFRVVGVRYGWLKGLFDSVPARVLAVSGRLRAERAAWLAVKRVPAYRSYLESVRIDPDRLPPAGILDALPETDKHSYIDPYPLEARCVGGQISFKGVTIDESSGSSGTPYNWIRGQRERAVAHRNIAFFARYAFGAGDLVTLNAFSMGAWATGFNMSLGLTRHGIVKSIGPDIGKILSTLRFLGPRFRYLICGYPPFVKHLLDEGERQGFDWDAYRPRSSGTGCSSGSRSCTPGMEPPTSKSGWQESRRSASRSGGWRGSGPTFAGPCSGTTRGCRWSFSTTP
jgi:hypothetical protein